MMRAHTKDGVSKTQAGDTAMFSKTAFALTIILATASGSLAATKSHATNPAHDVYDVRGAYAGSDADANVRFELQRDAGARGN
jgi:hypothetical protein